MIEIKLCQIFLRQKLMSYRFLHVIDNQMFYVAQFSTLNIIWATSYNNFEGVKNWRLNTFKTGARYLIGWTSELFELESKEITLRFQSVNKHTYSAWRLFVWVVNSENLYLNEATWCSRKPTYQSHGPYNIQIQRSAYDRSYWFVSVFAMIDG